MHLNYFSPQEQEIIVTKPSIAWTLACGIAAGFVTPIPTAAVQDIASYADGSCELMKQVLGVFNEVRPIDIDFACQVGKSMFYTRYDLCHQSLTMMTPGIQPECCFSSLGIGVRFSPEVLQQIKEHTKDINQCLMMTIRAASGITQQDVSQ